MTETRIINVKTGGMKGAKPEDYSLIPWEQMQEVAKLYSFGANKYNAHNWRNGYDWSLSFASLIRHATAWWSGEFDDDESGCDHMASVVFHALALMYFREHHSDLDNRYCKSDETCVGSLDENHSNDSDYLRNGIVPGSVFGKSGV